MNEQARFARLEHGFEILLAANSILLFAVIRLKLRLDLGPFLGFQVAFQFLGIISLYILAALLARAVITWARRGRAEAGHVLRDFFRVESLLNLARLLAVIVLTIYCYVWLKVFVPLLNTHLYDAGLLGIDRVMHFGLNPNFFLFGLFPNPAVLRVLDLEYALFHVSMVAGAAWFIAAADAKERTRFVYGFCLLWVVGSWLYLAVPSLGPCYSLGGDYAEIHRLMPFSARMQAALIRHYNMILKMPTSGVAFPVIAVFGVAAFPSLHVATQAFLAFWSHGRNRLLLWVFAILTVLTFVASLISGWHYAIDSYAGIILALLAVLPFKSARRVAAAEMVPAGREAGAAKSG